MKRREFLTLAAALQASAATARSLESELARYEVVDTHEHILTEEQRTSEPCDFFTLASHYAVNDVISAGMPKETHDWREFEPWWRYAKYTGYGQCLRIAIDKVYGFPEISAATIPKINDAIKAANKPGLYQKILKDQARIRFAVNDEYWNSAPHALDPRYFVLAKKFDWFVTPVTKAGVGGLEKLAGRSISTLQDLCDGLAYNFEQNLKLGMVTVKTTLAYNRELLFHEVSRGDAERSFESLMRDELKMPEGFRSYESRPYRQLADYLFHQLMRLCDSHSIPIQIHTGLHAGNGNWLTNSRPSLLQNLFYLYPKVKIDLFHLGYPYMGEVAVFAKEFPNVYADMCWMHIVSPSESRSALDNLLDMVPVNKIFGFGGDYRYPELSYAHMLMAKQNIAMVLTARMTRGLIRESEALDIAKLLLLENGAQFFGPKQRSA